MKGLEFLRRKERSPEELEELRQRLKEIFSPTAEPKSGAVKSPLQPDKPTGSK